MMQTPLFARFPFNRSRRSFGGFLFLSACAAAAVSLAVGGCGGGGGGSVSTSATSSPAASPTVTASPTPFPSPSLSPAANVVSVSPASVTVNVHAQTPFTAIISGVDAASSQTIVWSVQETGGGTMTPDGVYSAPGIPGTYHIVATSQTTPVSAGGATVVVQAGDAAGTIQ